jgi:hypothetical protein
VFSPPLSNPENADHVGKVVTQASAAHEAAIARVLAHADPFHRFSVFSLRAPAVVPSHIAEKVRAAGSVTELVKCATDGVRQRLLRVSAGDSALYDIEMERASGSVQDALRAQPSLCELGLGAQARSVRAHLQAFLTAARGLRHLHARGLAHRDIKPANLLVFNAAVAPVYKFCDFGFAVRLNSLEDLRATSANKTTAGFFPAASMTLFNLASTPRDAPAWGVELIKDVSETVDAVFGHILEGVGVYADDARAFPEWVTPPVSELDKMTTADLKAFRARSAALSAEAVTRAAGLALRAFDVPRQGAVSASEAERWALAVRAAASVHADVYALALSTLALLYFCVARVRFRLDLRPAYASAALVPVAVPVYDADGLPDAQAREGKQLFEALAPVHAVVGALLLDVTRGRADAAAVCAGIEQALQALEAPLARIKLGHV